MKTQKLPPGLVDENIEFFVDGYNRLLALYLGKTVKFEEVPKHIIHKLTEEMYRNEDVMAEFRAIGVDVLTDQLYTYTKCFYGGFNYTPDMTPEGTMHPDNYSCGNDCRCCLSSIKKGELQVKNGSLSRREIEVTRLLTHSFLGKQIAGELSISENTVNKHKQNIFRKTGMRSNVELAVWATNENLV